MSSLIDAAGSLGRQAQNGEQDSRIIHFDATQRRKEKMRQKSQEAPPLVEPFPQPAVVASQLKTSEAAAANPPSNGAATLEAYAAPASPPAGVPSALSQLSGAELEQFLIDFVVEQTGYPPEMVELEADLEADLGIDSIKKAQLFGELAERFAITVDVTDESLSLDDFPTLGHVMQFLQAKSTGTATPLAPSVNGTHAETPANGVASPAKTVAVNPLANGNGVHADPKPAPVPTAVSDALAGRDLESFLVDFVVEQTGYPPEMVELDADLEADLGIDSIKKAQLFGELAEQFAITVDVTDQNLSLDDFPTLRHVMEFLQSAGSSAPASPFQNRTAQPEALAEVAAPVASSPTETMRSASPEPKPAESEPAEIVAASALGQEDLETFLVNFVVEQTGYPPEMVELDADLEADLGIDSIKKAQMMGELAEQFAISVDVTDENLSLDDFPTLRHVCSFLATPGKAAV